jgi:hypothetical protein
MVALAKGDVMRKHARILAAVAALVAGVGIFGLATPVSAGPEACTYVGIGCTSSSEYSGYVTGTNNDTHTWASADTNTDNNSYGNGLSVRYNTNSARHRDANYDRFCGYQGTSYTGGLSFSVAYSYPGFYDFTENRQDRSIRMVNGSC